MTKIINGFIECGFTLPGIDEGIIEKGGECSYYVTTRLIEELYIETKSHHEGYAKPYLIKGTLNNERTIFIDSFENLIDAVKSLEDIVSRMN